MCRHQTSEPTPNREMHRPGSPGFQPAAAEPTLAPHLQFQGSLWPDFSTNGKRCKLTTCKIPSIPTSSETSQNVQATSLANSLLSDHTRSIFYGFGTHYLTHHRTEVSRDVQKQDVSACTLTGHQLPAWAAQHEVEHPRFGRCLCQRLLLFLLCLVICGTQTGRCQPARGTAGKGGLSRSLAAPPWVAKHPTGTAGRLQHLQHPCQRCVLHGAICKYFHGFEP